MRDVLDGLWDEYGYLDEYDVAKRIEALTEWAEKAEANSYAHKEWAFNVSQENKDLEAKLAKAVRALWLVADHPHKGGSIDHIKEIAQKAIREIEGGEG